MSLEISQLVSPDTPFPPIEEVLSSKGKIKILKILTEYTELNISEIVRQSHLNHATVSQHLSYFEDIGIVQEKTFGRIRIYRLAPDDAKVQIIRELIESWEH